MFTHREETAHAGAEFFARVTFRVLHQDLTPLQAIEAVAADSGAFVRAKVAQALAKVEEAVDPGSNLSREPFVDDAALTAMASVLDLDGEAGSHEPIKVGLSSATEGTLPGAVYFIVRYNSLEAAAKANAKVGGDNASRGVGTRGVLGWPLRPPSPRPYETVSVNFDCDGYVCIGCLRVLFSRQH